MLKIKIITENINNINFEYITANINNNYLLLYIIIYYLLLIIYIYNFFIFFVSVYCTLNSNIYFKFVIAYCIVFCYVCLNSKAHNRRIHRAKSISVCIL